jgi:hypothetical protein
MDGKSCHADVIHVVGFLDVTGMVFVRFVRISIEKYCDRLGAISRY